MNRIIDAITRIVQVMLFGSIAIVLGSALYNAVASVL